MNQIVTAKAQQETDRAVAIIEEAEYIAVKNADDYEYARGIMKKVKARIKEIGLIRKGQTLPLDESKKKIMEFFRVPLERLEGAKGKLNTAMVNWAEEQESKRREEERRLKKEAEEKAMIAAEKAEAAGKKEEAEQIVKQEIEAKPVKVASTVPISKESHIRETWSAKVINLMDLIKAVAEGKVSIRVVEANLSALNALARAEKQDLDIPGVEAVSKKTQL